MKRWRGSLKAETLEYCYGVVFFKLWSSVGHFIADLKQRIKTILFLKVYVSTVLVGLRIS
jgi:hypothetical protein